MGLNKNTIYSTSNGVNWASMTDTNGSTAPTGNGVERTRTGQFVRGHRGVAGAGRKVGSRNKLAESFLADLQKVWAKKGAAALNHVADTAPEVLVKVIAGILPRQLLAECITLNANVDAASLFAQARDFNEAFALAKKYLGSEPPLIESEAEELEPVEDEDDA
jgi:hypothetical protein